MEENLRKLMSRKWNTAMDHAIITHQDGMNTLYLLYLASRRLRTSHAIDMTSLGISVPWLMRRLCCQTSSQPKDRRENVEIVIIDHLLRSYCKSLKEIVSENATVEKIWLKKWHYGSNALIKDWTMPSSSYFWRTIKRNMSLKCPSASSRARKSAALLSESMLCCKN